MSVLELLRGATSSATGGSASGDESHLHRHLLAGAGTALASSLALVLPALLVWVASAQSSVPWTDALALGAALWLVGQGAQLTLGTTAIAFTPLLLLAGALGVAAWGAARSSAEVAEECSTRRHQGGLLPRGLTAALLAWTTGYAVVAGLWAAVALAGPAGPRPLSLVFPILLVPVAGAGAAALRAVSRRPELAGPRWRRPRFLPDSLRRAVRPALLGAGAMLAVGAAVCALLLVLKASQVSHLHDELAPGLIGGAALTLGQSVALPNAALWAVSFLAGTGFSVVEGASVTWTGSRSGLMPIVPALGGLPSPGAFPGLVPALVLLPVAVGALIGWRSLRSVARLSTARTKATVAGLAVGMAAGALGLLDTLGGGSLGSARLSSVGAPAGWMTLALLAEFAIGAALVLAWDHWRLRR